MRNICMSCAKHKNYCQCQEYTEKRKTVFKQLTPKDKQQLRQQLRKQTTNKKQPTDRKEYMRKYMATRRQKNKKT